MKKSQLKLFLKKIVTEARLLESIQDPSKDEMFEYLRQMYGNEESFRDDAEVAIYWFANFYHGGQSSHLYSALSTSRFSPGPIAKGPEKNSSEEMMYDDLVLRFAPKSEEAIEIQTKHNSLNEAVSPKNQERIEKWIRELGTRKTAYKIIGIIVRQKTMMDIEDMADTATLASGIDSVEQLLVDGEFEKALRAALEAAREFFDEEAGEGLFEGEEADAVNGMWAGSDDDLKSYEQPKPSRSKQKSKKFFSGKPKAKTVQDFDWEKIRNGIDKSTLSEGTLQSLAAALMLGTIGFNTPVVKNLMHTPQGQQAVMKVKQAWGSMPQTQRTIQKAQELWNRAMTPTKASNPTQVLPDEQGMDAAALAQKYSDRNDDVAQKTNGFVQKYISGQVK